MLASSKTYVDVVAAFRQDGTMLPLYILWENGKRYKIDKVFDIRPAPSLKSGGQGDRYTVRIENSLRFLFFERNTDPTKTEMGKWFIERP